MRLSDHSKRRAQQRGISQKTIELILKYGTTRRKPNGAVEYIIKSKRIKQIQENLKKEINLLDKAKGIAVLTKNNIVITTYHMK